MGETERQGPRTVGSRHTGAKLLLDSCCRSERPGGGRSRDIQGQETEGLTEGRSADENLRLRTSWAPPGERRQRQDQGRDVKGEQWLGPASLREHEWTGQSGASAVEDGAHLTFQRERGRGVGDSGYRQLLKGFPRKGEGAVSAGKVSHRKMFLFDAGLEDMKKEEPPRVSRWGTRPRRELETAGPGEGGLLEGCPEQPRSGVWGQEGVLASHRAAARRGRRACRPGLSTPESRPARRARLYACSLPGAILQLGTKRGSERLLGKPLLPEDEAAGVPTLRCVPQGGGPSVSGREQGCSHHVAGQLLP